MNMSTKKTKNKDFQKWTKAESCYRKDNIVSTDWHERLERLPLFVPSYAKCRPEMVYIMSMEYGRIWQKEKDDWFAQIFQAQPKEQDIKNRSRKLRKEFLEAKRQAEIKVRERKERLEKEAAAKAKAEAEALEKAKKIKAKLEKSSVKKKEKKQKEKKEKKNQTASEPTVEKQSDQCPQGWTQVELTLQCECAANKAKDRKEQEEVKRYDQQSKKIEDQQTDTGKKEMPCSPGCMATQMAEALERAQGNSTNNCEANTAIQARDSKHKLD